MYVRLNREKGGLVERADFLAVDVEVVAEFADGDRLVALLVELFFDL